MFSRGASVSSADCRKLQLEKQQRQGQLRVLRSRIFWRNAPRAGSPVSVVNSRDANVIGFAYTPAEWLHTPAEPRQESPPSSSARDFAFVIGFKLLRAGLARQPTFARYLGQSMPSKEIAEVPMRVGVKISVGDFRCHKKSLISGKSSLSIPGRRDIVKKVAMSGGAGYNRTQRRTSMAATETIRRNPLTAGVRQTKIILEMIKFEHTVFMLPFALMAAVIAGHRDWLLFGPQAALDPAGDGRRTFRRDGL